MNARPGRSIWNLPGSCSLLCGFPTCLRASWLPVVWPRWGKGCVCGGWGSDVGHWLSQDQPRASLPAALGLNRLTASGCRGGGGPPRGLVGGSRLAAGLPPLSLPKRGAQRESLGPSPAGLGLARVVRAPLPSSPSAEARASAAVGRQRAVPSHWSQIIASCFVVWCLGPGASHLWGRAVARASLRNYPPPHRRRRH